MTITKKSTPNQNTGRAGGRTPDIIVCHITEGAFDGAVSWLMNPTAQASAHFVVARDGRITQLVDIADTAWGNGTTTGADNRGNRHSRLAAVRERNVNANSYTISIEHEGILAQTNGALTAAQADATAWLIGHIRGEVKRIYNFDIPVTRENIVGHADVTPRWKPNCPGPDFPFDEIISRLKGENNVPDEASNPDTPSSWAAEVWEWGIKNGITSGAAPRSPATREEVVSMIRRYDRAAKTIAPL